MRNKFSKTLFSALLVCFTTICFATHHAVTVLNENPTVKYDMLSGSPKLTNNTMLTLRNYILYSNHGQAEISIKDGEFHNIILSAPKVVINANKLSCEKLFIFANEATIVVGGKNYTPEEYPGIIFMKDLMTQSDFNQFKNINSQHQFTNKEDGGLLHSANECCFCFLCNSYNSQCCGCSIKCCAIL